MTITKKALRRTAGAVAAGLLALAGTLAGAGTAQAAYDAGTHTIWNDEPLYPGWHVGTDYARLIMQGDGNLVFYRTMYANDWSRATPMWASNTVGCGTKAVMKTEGRLVVYGADGRECSSRGWNKGSSAYACLQVTNEQGLSIWYTDRQCGSFSGMTARTFTNTSRDIVYSDLY